MTKTDTWRRPVVETREGASLLFDPVQVFCLEVDGHDTLVRTAGKSPYRSSACRTQTGVAARPKRL